MAFPYQTLFIFLSLAVAASHAALSPEDYWKSALPNTPMPKAIKNALPPKDWLKENSVSIDMGKLAANSLRVAQKDAHINGIYLYGRRGYSEEIDESINDQSQIDPRLTLFFFEKDMKLGRKMNLAIINSKNRATFLPRQVAQSTPFSSKTFPEILRKFQLEPNSAEANITKKTIKLCERQGVIGEQKSCLRSLESMIGFCTSNIGRNVQVISAEVEKEILVSEKYTITGVTKVGGAGDKTIACHKLIYASAVFYCHNVPSTVAYVVSLVGANGGNVKAVAVCHEDTSTWNPKHIAFQYLKVKPGSVPICHFIQESAVVWVPK